LVETPAAKQACCGGLRLPSVDFSARSMRKLGLQKIIHINEEDVCFTIREENDSPVTNHHPPTVVQVSSKLLDVFEQIISLQGYEFYFTSYDHYWCEEQAAGRL
jgi:hypothetical protein